MYQINESIRISFDGQKEWSILRSQKEINSNETNSLYGLLKIESYTNNETYNLEKKLYKKEKMNEAKIKVYYGQVLVYESIFNNLSILGVKEEISEETMPITTISLGFESNEIKVYKDLGNIVKSEF